MVKFKLFVAVLATETLFVTLPATAEGLLGSHLLRDLEEPVVTMPVAHKSSHRPTIRVTGVITREGVECTALRGDDGKLYTLAGRAGGFQPGDRVRVIGKLAQVSFCMQGTTIEVRRIIASR